MSTFLIIAWCAYCSMPVLRLSLVVRNFHSASTQQLFHPSNSESQSAPERLVQHFLLFRTSVVHQLVHRGQLELVFGP